MKKNFFLMIVLFPVALFGQEKYKMDFLTLFDRVPVVETCQAASDIVAGKSAAAVEFRDIRATADSAFAELNRLQLAVNVASMPSGGPSMSVQDAKALKEKMKNMSKEEKIKWAIENAGKMMPQNAAHASKDMNNKPVNDAVASVTTAQEPDMMYYAAPTDFGQKSAAIEAKYRPALESAKEKFRTESGMEVTIIAEGTEAMWKAKYAGALQEYKKTVIPIFNAELKEKRDYLGQLIRTLIPKATPVEATIASTHYADDAKENSNKSLLILAHLRVLGKVQEFLGAYGEIFDRSAAEVREMTALERP